MTGRENADGTTAQAWVGRPVLDSEGATLGAVTAVVDDPHGTWLAVQGAGVSGLLPAQGAVEAGGDVKVSVTRAQVIGAPRTALPDQVSEFEAAALRRHYARDPGQGQSDGPDPVRLALAATGFLALLVWVVRRLRRKPEPQTAAERLLDVGRTTGAAVAHRAKELADTAGRTADIAGRTVAVVTPVAVTAAGAAAHQVAEGAATVASGAGHLAARAAGTGYRVADAVTDAVTDAVSDVPQVAGSVAGSVAESVTDTVEELQRTWRKVTNRLTFVVFLAVGYVLGARAGTERYDAIVRMASKATGKEPGARRPDASRPASTPDLQPLSTTPPDGNTMG